MSSIRSPLPSYLYICLGSLLLFFSYLVQDIVTRLLIYLSIFRYFRLLVGLFGYFLHKSVPISATPRYYSYDIVAILPTVNPQCEELLDTIISVLEAGVAYLVVVVPQTKYQEINLFNHQDLVKHIESGKLRFERSSIANKRQQVSVGLKLATELKKSIIVLVDDHVLWPSGSRFLSNILAPFEDDQVGGVAMWKNVTRTTRSLFSPDDFWNFIGCLYLERHNFDITASHYIDEGLFVISGRTAAYRSEILCDEEFIRSFCNEQWWCFGIVGPLNADDDNFITRWLVNHEWKIGWQHGSEATMTTTIGDSGFEKFNNQCLRWARTTLRSNSKSLLVDRHIYSSQPWSVYSVYVSNLVNFALFTDVTLVYLSWCCARYVLWFIIPWMFCSKLVKSTPHFIRYPRDLIYLGPYILFGYYHSLLKLYAFLTARNITWGSRPGVVS